MRYSDIASQHYIGERFKAFTEWEGKSEWHDVYIEEMHRCYAKVAIDTTEDKKKYSWCIHWSDFLDPQRVIYGG